MAPQKEPIVPDEKPDPKDEQATRAYELQQLRIKLLRLTSRLDQSPTKYDCFTGDLSSRARGTR